jgi:hypothetical protein
MPKDIRIRVSPDSLEQNDVHRKLLAEKLDIDISRLTHIELLKRALDARSSHPVFELIYRCWLDSEKVQKESFTPPVKDVSKAKSVIIVGAGPAGLFAALRLIELGLRPIVLERGKDVRSRRRDVALLSKQGVIDPDSNYCFGEGGAGTFSDGKLYTRSTKRGSRDRILNMLVAHGASKDILIETHPHIGTNKLPAVVQALSQRIIDCGGEIHFNQRMNSITCQTGTFVSASTSQGLTIESEALILATGHSARDITDLLEAKNIRLEAKPFALGVRVEHPQSSIDLLQYKQSPRHAQLPAASYSLRTQVENRGVFSFCMCPGGVICPAATDDNEVVVNGWSPSKRNSKFANSGIVVEISQEDLEEYGGNSIYAGLNLQKEIEQRAYELGGGAMKAPAELLSSFIGSGNTSELPECSYKPGITPVDVASVFPESIARRLKEGLAFFAKSRKGFLHPDAVVVATESRTSSPIRIPRNKDSYMHPDVRGFFPCGEGAGYAGGIMSAAIDGERVAEAVASFLSP